MRLVRTIRVAVSVIAVAGLLFAPLAVAVGVVPAGSDPAMSHQAMVAMPDMSCCPEKIPEDCPYMTMCLGSYFQKLPDAVGLLMPDAPAQTFVPADDPSVRSLGPAPPGRPPKT